MLFIKKKKKKLSNVISKVAQYVRNDLVEKFKENKFFIITDETDIGNTKRPGIIAKLSNKASFEEHLYP